MQRRPGSGDSESQQSWDTDSAICSGTSSPTPSVSSLVESLPGKNNLAEEVQAKFQVLQADLEELNSNLRVKDSEVGLLTEKLDIEKDKNLELNKELSKVNKNLENSQKLLRQFHTKKLNWANYYVDLEADYYNGINYHVDHINWLEGECQKLKRSNRFFKKRSYKLETNLNEHLDKMDKQTKAQETGADRLAKDLKKQLDIMDKNMKAQDTKNRDISLQNRRLNENLAKEKHKSSALGIELKLCKEDLQKSIATRNSQTNQDHIIEDLKREVKDLKNKSKQASLLCDCGVHRRKLVLEE